MRLKLAIPVLLLAACIPGFAESIDPDLPRLIRDSEKPKVHYGPARVGWYEPARPAETVANATFERLRWDSPDAIRQELMSVVVPQWQMLVAFGVLILGLRRLRSARQGAQPAVEVISFPLPRPRQEAA